MKLSQRILQFSTLALFSSMIGSLVLYRGGFFEASSSLPSWFSEVKQDSVPPPWFDSVQFKQILREATQERIMTFGFSIENATQYDSLRSLDILRTRYEVAHLSKQEARQFKRIFSAFRKEKRVEFHLLPEEGDSSQVLSRLRYGPQHLPQLSEQEKMRFKFVLDSLTRPRMMSSKTGLIFISAGDTTRAIKIVKAEKYPK